MVKQLVFCLLMTFAAGSFVQAGVVTILGGEIRAGVKKSINDFYNSLAGHSSTIATGELITVSLTTTTLLWLTEPMVDYTSAELSTMAGFIAAGGRIAFLGEHGQVAVEQNTRINAALSFLGSTISINVTGALDDNFRSASVADGQILSHPLTVGVQTYEYGWFAPLTISGTAQALMLGEEPFNGKPSVMMGFQNIGAGTVFVIADQSMWDSASFSWPGGFDNARMFENLLLAGTSDVPAIGEGVALSPVMDTTTVGGFDTLIAKVQNTAGVPGVGRRVIFEIVSGPHSGVKDTGITNSAGNALFIYTGLTVGLDEISATIKNPTDSQIVSNHAFHVWKKTGSNPPLASAGADRTVFSGAACNATVTLDGTGSFDPDHGTIALYSWQLPWGATAATAKTDVTMPTGMHTVILTVVNNNGNSDNDTVVITVVHHIPTLSIPTDTIIDEGNLLELRITTGSNDKTVPRITASGLPPGAVFADSGNGTSFFSWNPGCNSHGVYTIILTARDPAENCMDSISGSFRLSVRDVNFPPGFLPQNDTAVAKNNKFSLVVKSRDCDNEVPEIKAVSIPPGSTVNDHDNGTATLEWAPGTVDSGYYSVILEAADAITAVRDTIGIRITGVIVPHPPAQLSGGYYVDENADGMVDAVYLTFSKAVPIDSLTVSLTWPGSKKPDVGVLSQESLSYKSVDCATLRVAIPAASQRASGIKTGGRMSAMVRFSAFVDEVRTGDVIDSAAPVIDSAIYRVGPVANSDGPTDDTLQVWFSEPVRIGPTSTPLTLLSDTASMYTPSLELGSIRDNYAIFIVKGAEGVTSPENGDSIFINPGSTVGDSLNRQDNPANRRVILRWEPGAAITIIPIGSSGENPMDISRIKGRFGIMESSGKIIGITTKQLFDTLQRDEKNVIDEKDGKSAFGSAVIYDPVGNLVNAELLIKKASFGRVYYVVWDGTNRYHRRVAPGVYLIRIAFSIDDDLRKKSKKFDLHWR